MQAFAKNVSQGDTLHLVLQRVSTVLLARILQPVLQSALTALQALHQKQGVLQQTAPPFVATVHQAIFQYLAVLFACSAREVFFQQAAGVDRAQHASWASTTLTSRPRRVSSVRSTPMATTQASPPVSLAQQSF